MMPCASARNRSEREVLIPSSSSSSGKGQRDGQTWVKGKGDLVRRQASSASHNKKLLLNLFLLPFTGFGDDNEGACLVHQVAFFFPDGCLPRWTLLEGKEEEKKWIYKLYG